MKRLSSGRGVTALRVVSDHATRFQRRRRGGVAGRGPLVAACLVAGLLLLSCGPSAPQRTPAAAPPGAPAPAGAPAGSTGSAPAPATPAASAPGPAPRVETVKIATQPIPNFAAVFLGRERGYFRDEGIELEEGPFDTSAQIIPALAAGQIDVGAGGIAAGFFNAIAQGISARITLDLSTVPAGDQTNGVLVRKALIDSGRVRQAGDLRGLRAGFTSKGHSTEMLLDKALSAGGLSLQDVQTTELPYPEMNVALANDNLDVAASIEPYTALAVHNGWAVRWKSWADILPNDQVAVLMFSAGFADGRNEVAKRFAKAWLRGLRDYEAARTRGTDRESVIAILQQHTIMKDRALFDIVPWGYINPDGRVNAEAIAEAQDWFAAHGYVPRKVDVPSVIDYQFADYAVAQLGPYRP
jgi:NitT/TauT family transport system substrate-binding protein